MALPVVDGTNNTGTVSHGSTLGISHTVGSGLSNSLLIAMVGNTDSGFIPFPHASSATWNGVPMGRKIWSSSNFVGTLFYLFNPEAGGHTCTVNWPVSIRAGIVGVMSFSGARGLTATNVNDTSSGTGTAASLSFQSYYSDGLAFDMCYSVFQSHTQGAGQTLQTSATESDGLGTTLIMTTSSKTSAGIGTNTLAVTIGLSKVWQMYGFQVEGYADFVDVAGSPMIL